MEYSVQAQTFRNQAESFAQQSIDGYDGLLEKVYTKDIEWGLTLILNASFIGFLFYSKISMVKMYNHWNKENME